MAANFYPLQVVHVKPDTRDAVIVTLRPADEHRELFRFKAGQYLTFRKRLDDDEVRRSYSICAAEQDADIRVGIKRVQDGWFSRWAHEELRAGDVIEAMPPNGNFGVPFEASNRKHYLGFAGGSGITPLLGIVKTALLTEARSSFVLFYGNEASSTIMFREELEELKNRFMGRLSLLHVLNREHQDVELFNGMITKAKCEQFFKHWVDVSRVDVAFICGPQAMMVQIAESLQEHGLDKRHIKFELFATPGSAARKAAPGSAAVGPRGNLCEATIIIDGFARNFSMPKKTDALLDAGLKRGIELPYACKAGVCSTCRAMLLEGEVDMDANFALEDYEIARGYILTCQSYPVTDKIVVDYDK